MNFKTGTKKQTSDLHIKYNLRVLKIQFSLLAKVWCGDKKVASHTKKLVEKIQILKKEHSVV
jgi:hypothetical protein